VDTLNVGTSQLLWLVIRQAGVRWSRPAWLRFPGTRQSLMLLLAVCYSLLLISSWAMPRYRLPVDAVGLLFVALALVALAQRQRRLLGKVA
jgi:hypothetical protein